MYHVSVGASHKASLGARKLHALKSSLHQMKVSGLFYEFVDFVKMKFNCHLKFLRFFFERENFYEFVDCKKGNLIVVDSDYYECR